MERTIAGGSKATKLHVRLARWSGPALLEPTRSPPFHPVKKSPPASFPEKRVFSKWRPVRRYPKNPIITADMVPFSCRGIYNSSVVKHENRYVMVLRCEGYNFYNFFCLAESKNGYDDWTFGEIIPMPDDPEYRRYTRVQYDPRLTKLDDTYYMTFCCHGSDARMGLMSSKDMRTFRWEGFITGTGFRNTVIFPEKVGGLYTALERPNALGEIWVTQSPDLKFWGNQRLLMDKGKCSFGWGKIGPCGTPIRTKAGSSSFTPSRWCASTSTFTMPEYASRNSTSLPNSSAWATSAS